MNPWRRLVEVPRFLCAVVRDKRNEERKIYPYDHWARPPVHLNDIALALTCDCYGSLDTLMFGPDPAREREEIDRYVDSPGPVLHVRTWELEWFVAKVLPRIRRRFILATFNSDRTVPDEVTEAAEAIAASGKVVHWFTRNYSGRRYRDWITGVPIGLFFEKTHNVILDQQPRSFAAMWVVMRPVVEQERRLREVVARVPPTSRRLPLVCADFWKSNSTRGRRFGETRAQVRQALRRNPNLVWPWRRCSQVQLFRLWQRYAFVISPHGDGLDCYRTWEAMLAGCIVIVKTSPLDYLYRDLPVVIVGDWAEITRENLAVWAERFGDGFDRRPLHERLSLEYWRRLIRATATQKLN
ncbi:MAG: hypothetical protein HZC55_09280 [Verrucomicrobia bacterium]|nr:hypothetical protein [Verrucomicrobiota bacterium]